MNNRQVIGLDIGGTKCAVARLCNDGRVEEILRVPTGEFDATFRALCDGARALLDGRPVDFGVSCGGPLDAGAGVILSPPNLHPGWHGVPVCRMLTEAFGGRACLMNDANACALAEWKFGAGRGARHLLFLTSGTGFGAGLILNGELYAGATGDAGEIGHVRLAPDGPVGFGKAGSVEGFCSGGGIARLAVLRAEAAGGVPPAWREAEAGAGTGGAVTLKNIAAAARAGDALARKVLDEAGEKLGRTLAVLVDLFNPERIILGGFFPRCGDLLLPALRRALAGEALPAPASACRILSAELGETIGSHGAIAAALHGFHKENK
jgi:glucokinase